MKTLVTILNHNLPEYTNFLYNELKRHQTDSHAIFVFDNASTPEGQPDVIHLRTDENCYFGGAMNLMFDYILENEEYDSLLFFQLQDCGFFHLQPNLRFECNARNKALETPNIHKHQ